MSYRLDDEPGTYGLSLVTKMPLLTTPLDDIEDTLDSLASILMLVSEGVFLFGIALDLVITSYYFPLKKSDRQPKRLP